MTVPPTNDDIDAFVNAGGGAVISQLVTNAIASPGQSAIMIVLAYTQNDGTAAYTGAGDPTADQFDSALAEGYLSQYGADSVNFREYVYTYVAPTTAADFAADDIEQARINDQANWFPAP
jgi:hypothetical protein